MLLIDQLKHVYSEAELDLIDTAQFSPNILRKDFTVALNLQISGPDPDPTLPLFYGCGSSLNWDGYCNPEVDKVIEAQSRDGNPDRRKQIFWAIERKLAKTTPGRSFYTTATAPASSPKASAAFQLYRALNRYRKN